MEEKTDNFGFTLIDSLPDLLKSYNGDISVIDTLLKIIGSPSDGSSVTVDEPADPGVLVSTPGGDLAAEVEYFYTYTFVDPANGLESAPAPEESVVLPAEFGAPDAPTLATTTTGGDLTPGSYSYMLSYWVDFNTFETSAVDVASTTLHPADGNNQIITLTLPALGAADGFNVYRKRPGMSSYYFIGTVTGSGPTFVDDGLSPEDCERFAPVYSNVLSNFGVDVTIGTLPTDYHWKLYRSTQSGEYSNSLIATITDASTTFSDSGYETTHGTPPAVTPVLIPGTVGLRSGAGAPTAPDGNDGDWWINTTDKTLFGPKVAGAWPTISIQLEGTGSFIFNSSGAQSGRRFNDWEDLMSAVGATEGQMCIIFEQDETIGSTGMPVAGWDLNSACLTSITSGLPQEYPVITFDDGAKLDPVGVGLQFASGVVLRSISTSPVVTIDSAINVTPAIEGSIVVSHEEVFFKADDPGCIFVLSLLAGGVIGTASALADFGLSVAGSDHPAVGVVDAAWARIAALGAAAAVTDNCIEGSANLVMAMEVPTAITSWSTTHAGYSGTLTVSRIDTGSLSHIQAVSGNWTLSDGATLAAHLDELAQRIYDLENP